MLPVNKKCGISIFTSFVDFFKMPQLIETMEDVGLKPFTLSLCRNPSMDLSQKIDTVSAILALDKNIAVSDARKIVLRFLENKIKEEESDAS